MGFYTKKTEGGQGGKKGRSNMEHWTRSEELKTESNKVRREVGKKEIKESLNENKINEPEELRKERIRLSKTTAEKVVPSKKNPPYDRAKEKDSKDFKGFLESLKGRDQDTLLENFKEGYKACFESDEIVPVVKPFKLFDVTTAKSVAEEIKTKINAPHVYPNISTLGGAEHVSILFTVALDPKETWANGILQNSRYMQFSLDNDGVLENFSGHSGIEKTFRKTRVKSVEDLINKVNSHISLAPKK